MYQIIPGVFSLFCLTFFDIKMLIFSLSLISYELRMSEKKCSWINLWNTDISIDEVAILYQKILQKYVKAKMDIAFLKQYNSTDAYTAKFAICKNVEKKRIERK